MLGSVRTSELDRTGCCQALRQMCPCMLMESRCQSSYNVLNFASWLAIFGFAKASFFALSYTKPNRAFTDVHDLDAFR